MPGSTVRNKPQKITEETLPALRTIIDNIRLEGFHPELKKVVTAIIEKELKVSTSQLRQLLPNDYELAMQHTKKFISDFIVAYLADSPPKTVLDPCVGLGETINAIVKNYETKKAIGIEINQHSYEVGQLLHRGKKIDWILGDGIDVMSRFSDKFDVVVADPPWGVRWKRETSLTTATNEQLNFARYLEEAFIYISSSLIAANGVGFYIVPPSFLPRKGTRIVRGLFRQLGVDIEAALHLPANTFAPAISAPGLLLIVRRNQYEKLFIGELNDSIETQETLLRNLRQRREGKVLELGALVEFESFTFYSKLRVEREREAMARSNGLMPVPLIEIAKEIRLIRHNTEPEDVPNSLFLPLIGKNPAVTAASDMKMKPHNYAQIVLFEEKVSATYLANFFNTPLGYTIRDSLLVGAVIPKITKTSLKTTLVYLPDIEKQNYIVSVNTQITNLSTQLETLRTELWANPRKAPIIGQSVDQLNRENDFIQWVDTLPFPIASILWTYDAAKTSREKVDHLFYFFEAFSQWTSVVLLSGFCQDLAFCEQEYIRIKEEDLEHQKHYLRADFGAWNSLYARLAKAMRRLKENKEKFAIVRDLFGNPDDAFIEMISHKNTYSLLDKLREYRNEWKGHGGIPSNDELKRRRTILEENLADLRKIVAGNYSATMLLSPVTLKYSEGIYKNTVKILVGTRTPFRQKSVKTTIPLDNNKLYIRHREGLKPFALLPFIRIMPSPQTRQNACYFYSRVNGNDIRWVSYHFETESDVLIPDDGVKKALAVLVSDESLTQ